MCKTILALLLCFCSMPIWAALPNLPGYRYAKESQPTGKEWESPELIALNKEQPKAYFFSFEDVNSARKVLPENSKYWQSLNGDWKFNWAPDPDSRPANFYEQNFDASTWDNVRVPMNWNVYGIQKDGSQKYGVPIYVNQPVIFQHSVKVDDWRGGVMRTPPTHWTTYKHRNEVGSFLKEFKVDPNWNGREVFLNFDGVDSFFYLWVNGRYVGFSKNSRNTASFNITSYLQKGKNTLAVEVYRSSDGSFLEAQDMFRLPGIFRTVALHSTPKVQISDLVVKPSFDSDYVDGRLAITADVRNLSGKKIKDYSITYSLYQNKLYSDENTLVEGVQSKSTIEFVGKAETRETIAKLEVKAPKKWSAEEPYRYTLVAQLRDKKGRVVETVSTIVGFRVVEIKDTPEEKDEFGLAGRYYYLNGKTIKLKGVNRHETNPSLGHAITRKQMEEEIMLMLKGNINHVRNSHYPTDPYWYFLCNKYGIYLEDEANIESHEYYYGEASLSHPKEWEKAHVSRVLEMVYANQNNPSIVIWSLGNEAGPGDNFVTAYNELKKVDDTLPVQYERNNSIVDMGSNQYPSIGWTREAVKGKYNIKYPFHISEYAHSMGNACGNLIDYWEAIESTNFFCGGAIWDWVDQAIYNYDKTTGEKYLGYGGDFGDTPNDGQFVMNGIVFADLEPKPQYYEVKKVYQYVGIKDVDSRKGVFEIFNKNYFTDLSNYELIWSVFQDGKQVSTGNLGAINLGPRKRTHVSLPININLKNDSEYFVKIQFVLKSDQPWAKRGYVQAEEQILLKSASDKPLLSEVAKGSTLKLIKSNSHINVEGDNFVVRFDNESGTIYSLVYGNEKIIEDGNGPQLNAIRAFVNNDNWFYKAWFENGLHNLKHKATNAQTYKSGDNIVVSYTVTSQAPNGAKIHGGTSSGKNSIEELTDRPFGANDFRFTTNQIWTVYPDGSIELQASVASNKESLILPRLGYTLRIPEEFENFTYYGRGPKDNYADRKSGQFIEEFTGKVKNEFVNFPKPQDMGNHEDVRWAALTSNQGAGAAFIATQRLSVSALQYSSVDFILASHPYQLPKVGATYLNLDVAVTGLGGNSCGQGGPLTQDRVSASHHNLGFIIRPLRKIEDLAIVSNVEATGQRPLSITRDRLGKLDIVTSDLGAEILYTINNTRKPQVFKEAFNLRNGGTVTAWFKSNPKVKTTERFEKIETVLAEVVFVSSEEAGYGDAKNLTDGDPTTIWHTMYSVTVAKHPHYFDLDLGEMKTIKGFTFLPRPGGGNGEVKDYTIHISADGKNWGEPIHKSAFERGGKEKKVYFKTPLKGRFFRFTALSEQNGQDFASGAEITILAE